MSSFTFRQYPVPLSSASASALLPSHFEDILTTLCRVSPTPRQNFFSIPTISISEARPTSYSSKLWGSPHGPISKVDMVWSIWNHIMTGLHRYRDFKTDPALASRTHTSKSDDTVTAYPPLGLASFDKKAATSNFGPNLSEFMRVSKTIQWGLVREEYIRLPASPSIKK